LIEDDKECFAKRFARPGFFPGMNGHLAVVSGSRARKTENENG